MKGSLLKRSYQTRPKILAIGAAVVAAACATALLLTGQAQAQTVYRAVGPDGRITFSDLAPAAASNVTATGAGGRPIAASVALPIELRQVASKYPVTLYTSTNCAPCGSGRALLSNRGIPFAEKTVDTAEDSEALQRISGESSLPFLTIGGQQIKGYSDSEWTQFLNAAGYPQTSVLPANFRNPAATPLVAQQKPAVAVPAAQAQAQPSVTAPPGRAPLDTTSNPAGIKF